MIVKSSVPKARHGKLEILLSFGLAMAFASQAMGKEFIIKLKSGREFHNEMTWLQNEEKLAIRDTHAEGRLVLVDLESSSQQGLSSQLDHLKQREEVEYVVENIRLYALEAPNDPQFPSQWALKKVEAARAWDTQKGDEDIVVAVTDTGVALQHEDLKDNAWVNKGEVPGNKQDDDKNGYVDDYNGWDFHGNDNDPNDETSARNPGHGTHCAGIIGAVGDNGVGVSGLAQKVRLMPVRFLGADGSGDLMTAAKTIDYATNNGADIISASWGAAVARSAVGPILEAIERAQSKGVIFVVAAANDGKSNDTREVYPANAGFDNVISVAASDANDQKPTWSNYGKEKVDLASPGHNILSTIPGNAYKQLSGTSMATPLVAGAVALILSQARAEGRQLKPLEVRAILQASGVKVGIETACQCRLDIARALDHVVKDELTVVPNAATLARQNTKVFYGIGGKPPYAFASSNPSVASIAADGTLTALAQGETTVSITDADGKSAQSHSVFVGGSKAPGGGGQCPFGPYCDILCKINPNLPWCQ